MGTLREWNTTSLTEFSQVLERVQLSDDDDDQFEYKYAEIDADTFDEVAFASTSRSPTDLVFARMLKMRTSNRHSPV
jgi:hypothetical protein